MTLRWPVIAVMFAGCTEQVIEVAPPVPVDEWDQRLAERIVDYNAALRIASLRLVGELPTLSQLKQVSAAADQQAAYEATVRGYLDDPRFARQMFRFWQDALKMGDAPALDSAPAFVAQLVVEDRSYLEVFTAATGTCPTFDPATARFTTRNCTNGAPRTVGLLTHPGVHQHFFGNFAFRRARWVQETFACTKYPAELAAAPTDVGGLSPYTGTFPFASIAGLATGGSVDFLDTSSVICANCHSNMNHIAPLLAYFDEAGAYSATMAVPTPFPNNPPARMADYLPVGESLAWRQGVPIIDMASLGAAMAADRDIAECAVARVWNWAMGKSDIVDGGVRVPIATIQRHVDAFTANGHRLRGVLFDVFTSDDFIRF